MTKKKIRVLHVINTLGLGGAETNLFNLVSAADASRFEVHVAYSSGGEIEERFLKGGIRLFKFSEKNHKIKSFKTFPTAFRLAGYIRKNKIDIVHTHSFNAHVWGLLAAKLTGRKLVEHVHDFRYLADADFRCRRGESDQYRYAKSLKNLSDAVIVLTRQNKDFLLKEGFYPEKKIRLVKNGISMKAPEPFSPDVLRTRLRIPGEAPVILTTARLAPEKNIDLIFRIAPEVRRRNPDAIFLIAGDGPLYEKFSKEAENHPNIHLAGFYADIEALLGIASIYLLPSFLELHSIAILEAMKMDVPLVVSKDVGSNSEFIENGRNGILLDPFSGEGWAETILKLLAEKETSKKIGEAGRRTCAEKFDIAIAAAAMENIYDELSKHKI